MTTSPVPPTHPPRGAESLTFSRRWWRYQRERFPIVAHGTLILAFSFCAVSLSRMLRQEPGWPGAAQLLVAFATCFAFFLQLRIADEFKDYHDDLQHRPYRPVQRGVVTLKELAVLFVLGALVQLLGALWLNPKLLGLLVVTWLYLAAMSKEFFIAGWLRDQPVLYMLSHMVIMPLVDLYATGTDWLTLQHYPPHGLIWFLFASYCNGLVIEIGRKIRSPGDEEPGVSTYSSLWGRRVAVGAWCAALLATTAFALITAHHLDHVRVVGTILALCLAGAASVGVWFARHPAPGRGKRIEQCAGVWTLVLYLSLGLVPHFFKGPI